MTRTLKTIDELKDISYYVELAEKKVGYKGDLRFQSSAKWGQKAGDFEILSFEPLETPEFGYHYSKEEAAKTPTLARIGFFTIRLTNTKFYNGRTLRVKVQPYVQSTYGDDYGKETDELYIENLDQNTGKFLKAYEFPILN